MFILKRLVALRLSVNDLSGASHPKTESLSHHVHDVDAYGELADLYLRVCDYRKAGHRAADKTHLAEKIKSGERRNESDRNNTQKLMSSTIHELAPDVVLIILSFLEMPDWHALRLVSPSWLPFQLTEHDLLWRPVLEQVCQTAGYAPFVQVSDKEVTVDPMVDESCGRNQDLGAQQASSIVEEELLLLQQEKADKGGTVVATGTMTRGKSVSARRLWIELLRRVNQHCEQEVHSRMISIEKQTKHLNQPHHRYIGLEALKTLFRDKQDEHQLMASLEKQFGRVEVLRVKSVIIGEGSVGKTCLIRVTGGYSFPNEYMPPIYDIDNIPCTPSLAQHYRLPSMFVSMWDTAGQHDYDRLRPLAYPGTHVFVLCFSVVNRFSFELVERRWLLEIMTHHPSAVVMLVGTKCDLRASCKNKLQQLMHVSREEAEHLARHHNLILYHETSALNNIGIEDMVPLIGQCALLADSELFRSRKRNKCILS